MDSKPKVTLVATAPDGTEVKIRTSAGYDWAGIAQRKDGTWVLLAKGWAYYSVEARARRAWRAAGRNHAHTGLTVVRFVAQRKEAD